MKQGVWADYKRSYRGPYGWTMWLCFFEILAVFGVTVWAAVQMFEAENTREQILWAVGTLTGLMWGAGLKLWAWSVIHRKGIEDRLDEIEKRLGGAD